MMRTLTIGDSTTGRMGSSPGVLRRWAALAAGVVMIWAFAFVLAPELQKIDMVRPLAEYVRESGIDASALYYTEVQETGEAEMYLRDALQYGP